MVRNAEESGMVAQESDALLRIVAANGVAAGRPGLARFKRALAADRNGSRPGAVTAPFGAAEREAAAANAVLDVEAEDL